VEWIRIEDRVPPRVGRYLIAARSRAAPDDPLIVIAWYDPESEPGRRWSLIAPEWARVISHWMEIPKPPPDPA
jgi:hypothetical protein